VRDHARISHLFKPPKISKGPLKYQICPFLQHQVDIYWTGSEDNYRTGSEDNYRMLKLPYLQHPVDINRKSYGHIFGTRYY